MKNSYKVLDRKREEKSKLMSPNRRWEGNINRDLKGMG